MGTERAHDTARPTTGRRLRPAWCLAAGACRAPRVGALAWCVVVVVTLTCSSLFSWQIRRFAHDWGPLFVSFGFFAWAAARNAARGLHRRRGERRRRQRDGAVLWRDCDWPTREITQRIARGMQGMRVTVAVWLAASAAFCSVGHVLSLITIRYGPTASWAWVAAPVAFVVLTYALPLSWLLVVVAPRLGRGSLVVAWPALPQLIGTRCTFDVSVSPGGARIDCARVFLRCIRVRHNAWLPLSTWNARLVWVAEARLPLGAHLGPDGDVRVEFNVPADLPSTDLHADVAVRWELLVLGTVGGADYAEFVDVPVYAATS